jgi:hypothetical protein
LYNNIKNYNHILEEKIKINIRSKKNLRCNSEVKNKKGILKKPLLIIYYCKYHLLFLLYYIDIIYYVTLYLLSITYYLFIKSIVRAGHHK